ncbi:MAG TPA: phosphatase PAP2 family protein [Bryobacteraceae bacterium]|nr:phosphatase PAP2 family protein [Bryobacteraceae bacterium]
MSVFSGDVIAAMAHAPRAVGGFIAARDHRLMRRVHGWRPPRWFRLWMLCATRGGDGWLWYAIGAGMLIFGGPRGRAAAEAAALACGAGIALFLWLKQLCNRPRPCAIQPHCWARLLPPDQFSFPSGHSITAFAFAGAAGALMPPLAPALLFCAANVAASRILLGMHFLSDVVAGALIGAGLGWFTSTLVL